MDMFQNEFIKEFISKFDSKHKAALFIQDKLHLTKDGAYRRLREASAFHPNEIAILSNLLDISLDAIIKISDEKKSILCTYSQFDLTDPDYLSYFHRVYNAAYKSKTSKLYLVCKRFPYIYTYFAPSYVDFAVYFLLKVQINKQIDTIDKFSIDLLNKLGGKIKQKRMFGEGFSKLYFELPSVEIINRLTIEDDLLKVKYCWDSELFESKEDALLICESIRTIVDHIKQQAILGKKFMPGRPEEPLADYKLYLAEPVKLEHLFCAKIKEDHTITIMINNSGDYLASKNERFTSQTKEYLDNLINLSSQISGENKRDRNKLFNAMYQRLDEVIDYIKG